MAEVRPPWEEVAAVLREQRTRAELSLRRLASMTQVSDSYLSQIERGLYEPSPEVLKSIARALNLPLRALYEQLGWLDAEDEGDGTDDDSGDRSTGEGGPPSVVEAIEADERLNEAQRRLMIDMYRNLVGDGGEGDPTTG